MKYEGKRTTARWQWLPLATLPLALLAACGGSDDGLPQLSAARPGTLQSCGELAGSIHFPNTSITAAAPVAAGALTVAGKPVRAHCQVTGKMFERVSAVDGKNYAIGFEMRLPNDWNGRFFYQANGGIDGSVVTATGAVNGGGGLDNALNMGFAVISSDAGHTAADGPFFGTDPQARLDFGYQAVGKLTPMAKNLIKTAYGREPDRSYFGGCSNGGRHAMVAASRYADAYDGILAGNPGFNLPTAAVGSIASAQIYASLATNPADIGTGFTAAERATVSKAVLEKCDALDGAKDGLIQDTGACQAAFNLERDVPTCSGARDGACLSAAQKKGIAQIFAGPKTPSGRDIYSSFPYDAGHAGGDVAFWEFTAPVALDSGGVGMIWSTPHENPATFNGPVFALTGNLDTMLDRIHATGGLFTESGMSFMIPPNPSDLSRLKERGAKLMVFHGTSDAIFSSDDTTRWYESLRRANNGDAADFARFYRVPGMNHCSGGPSTDQFDMLTPLVQWVENGVAPNTVIAQARGAGNPAGVNPDVPADWAANRTRPLCPYPQVARYNGTGDINSASSFSCRL